MYFTGFYDKTEYLLPELKDVVRPANWDVKDFSSWRRILDTSKFGGSLANHLHHNQGYDKKLQYEHNAPHTQYKGVSQFDELIKTPQNIMKNLPMALLAMVQLLVMDLHMTNIRHHQSTLVMAMIINILSHLPNLLI